MDKVKLLYIITSLGFGGAENLLLSYVKRLDKKKYSILVCCLRDKPDDLLQEISNYAEVIKLGIPNRFNPIIIIHLVKLIRRIKPQIIHTHLFQPRIYTAFSSLFFHKVILIAHKHNNVNLRKHNIFIILEILSFLFYKRIIAISQSVKKSLMKYELVPERKISIVYNGIDFNKFNESYISKGYNQGKKLTIGTVCRLERQKGLKYLLLAMRLILTKFPDTILEIIGEGSLEPELKLLSKKLGISNSVIFFGKFANVIPFYKRMDIFVLPSIYEGFGIVILEAMASGIPIVATNIEGIKEVIVNEISGLLVSPKNPDDLACAILQIIENRQLREKLIDEGIKRARLFDIDEHVKSLDNLYMTLLGEESYK
jgi:glycosyltransferase involved in cell wall biosynthesis